MPGVLGTGRTDVGFAFISMSAREPDGRDAEYLEWHSLDHRPEQHRLAGLRQSMRLVSTPECRAARAASSDAYDAVDHVMTYLFDDYDSLSGFNILGAALNEGGRMPLRLPTVTFMTADRVGAIANPAAVAGADVIPWRPSLGVYLIIERGEAPVDELASRSRRRRNLVVPRRGCARALFHRRARPADHLLLPRSGSGRYGTVARRRTARSVGVG